MDDRNQTNSYKTLQKPERKKKKKYQVKGKVSDRAQIAVCHRVRGKFREISASRQVRRPQPFPRVA